MTRKQQKIEKYEAQLLQVETAIERIVTGLQSYNKGDVSAQEANLRTLQERETALTKKLARLTGERPQVKSSNFTNLGY